MVVKAITLGKERFAATDSEQVQKIKVQIIYQDVFISELRAYKKEIQNDLNIWPNRDATVELFIDEKKRDLEALNQRLSEEAAKRAN